jgi:hypothetical protein
MGAGVLQGDRPRRRTDPTRKDLTMTQGNRVPDAAADEQTRAAATEDYGGVPISEGELAVVWLADPDAADTDAAADSDAADTDAAADSDTEDGAAAETEAARDQESAE